MHEPLIKTGVVIIGGPDYALFMKDRARMSKRKSYTSTQGKGFFGSSDFPDPLIEAIKKWDPAGILLGGPRERGDSEENMMKPRDPESEEERKRLAGLINKHLGGKRILCLSGAQDKLVPPHLAVPFMEWLKRAIGDGGSGSGGGGGGSSSRGGSRNDPEWKKGAGSGWMVSSSASSTSTEEQKQERWKGPDWKAGAGAGWMTGTGSGSDGAGAGKKKVEGGWADSNIVVEDIAFDGAGHEVTPSMVAEATRFIVSSLEGIVDEGEKRGGRVKL